MNMFNTFLVLLAFIKKVQSIVYWWWYQYMYNINNAVTSPSGVSEGHSIPHCDGCRDLGPLTFLVFSNCHVEIDYINNCTKMESTEDNRGQSNAEIR